MTALHVEPFTCPFTVLVDSAESQPFTFDGLRCDADKEGRPLYVPTRRCCLGRHPDSKGDYSIEGYSDRIGVERKSKEDCWGTVLGWETDYQRERNIPGRRDRFKKELENLSKLDAAMVVVEASFEELLADMPEWGTKPKKHNAKIFLRSIVAFQQDYKVPWLFAGSRRLAEVSAFRFLERWWMKERERVKNRKENP